MNRFHFIALSLITFAACLSESEAPGPIDDVPAHSESVSSGPGQCGGGSGQACYVATDGGTIQGTCLGVECCAGCIDTSARPPVCRTGNALASCGAGGAVCQNCNDNNDCTNDSCGGGSCNHYAFDHTHACNAGTGFCNGATLECCTDNLDHTCCLGCEYEGSCVTACPPSAPTCSPITISCY